MKKVISTTNAPAAIGPYSQAIEANGFVFASGQIPVNPETGEIPEGIEAQAEQVMKKQAYSSKTWMISQRSTASMQNISQKTARHVPAWRLQDFRRTSFLRWKRSQ